MIGRAPHATLLPSVAAASLAVFVFTWPALADQVVLEPLKDNTIFSESNSLSNGAGSGLFAGVTGGSAIRRALLAFDVAAAIPTGATITSAQLTMVVTRSNAGSETMALHRVVADWGEGASNSTEMGGGMGAAAAPGDATWHFRFFDSALWSSDGGDFVAASSATKSAGNSGAFKFASTTQMVADVQGWLDAPDANFGWMVRGNETNNGTAKRLASRETGTTSSRPKLTIVFNPPVGGSTVTPTVTLAPTATVTPSPTLPAPTATRTATATATNVPTSTAPPATVTPTAAVSAPPTSSATAMPSLASSPTATSTVPPSSTATPTPTQPPAPTDTATPVATATATREVATATTTPSPPSCVGDCDASAGVTINELILGVNIALGSQPIAGCTAFDPSGNGSVEINELIAAVNHALAGCQ